MVPLAAVGIEKRGRLVTFIPRGGEKYTFDVLNVCLLTCAEDLVCLLVALTDQLEGAHAHPEHVSACSYLRKQELDRSFPQCLLPAFKDCYTIYPKSSR